MMHSLYIEVMSTRSLEHRSWAQRIFAPLERKQSSLAPEKFGNHEPLEFMYKGPLDLSFHWGERMIWMNRKQMSHGDIWTTATNGIHTGIKFDVRYKNDLLPDLLSLAEEWTGVTDADVCYVHMPVAAEMDGGVRAREFTHVDAPHGTISMCWSTHLLRRYLPNFHWCMIFGRPYIELFGKEVLLSAPAHLVRELSTGQVLIQLSKDVSDLQNNYSHIAAVRQRVKDHLGRDAFWSPAMATYRAPTFFFPETGESLFPKRHPQDVCDDLFRRLKKDADAALRGNKFELPIAWYYNFREEPEPLNHLEDPRYTTAEAKTARFEQRYRSQGTLNKVAAGIARIGTVPVVDGAALLVHIEHESGFGRHLALPYKPGWAYSGFGEPVDLDYAPYLFPR